MKDIKLYLKLSKNQKLKYSEIKKHNAPYIVFPAGRRYGKTEFAVRWQCPQVMKVETTEDSPHGWCSPVFRQAKLGFFKYRKFLRMNQIPHRAVFSDLIIDLFGSANHRVQFYSTDRPEMMEGFSFKSMVMEEAGIQLKRREIWENSIQLTLADFNAPCLFTGTPKGKGLYQEMYMKGLDPQNKDFISLHATSYDNCIDVGGYIPREVLDRIVRNLPEKAVKQEIYAEFIDDAGMVFRNTRTCVRGGAVTVDDYGVLILKPYDKSKKYIGGLDIAKVKDWTVLTIGTHDGEIHYMERFNQLDWSVQKERIKKACKMFHVKLLMDSTGVGDAIYEDLRKNGVAVEGYYLTSTTKKQLIDRLIVAIENGVLKLPNWDTLINEFNNYEYQITSSGNITMNAMSGMNDDIVISVGLFNMLVNNGVTTGDAVNRISFGSEIQSSGIEY